MTIQKLNVEEMVGYYQSLTYFQLLQLGVSLANQNDPHVKDVDMPILEHPTELSFLYRRLGQDSKELEIFKAGLEYMIQKENTQRVA